MIDYCGNIWKVARLRRTQPEPMHSPNPSADGPYRERYASETNRIAPAILVESLLDTS